MASTHTVIIGAGQAGLAMSRCLSDLGIDHVVLERGGVAQRWRSHGWDSLHLLTPNWMTRLPGFAYQGSDPDGFMSTRELVAFLEQYAHASRAPIASGTTVRAVTRTGDRFRVDTDRGVWSAASVVVATGHSALPAVPALSRQLPPWITPIAPAEYRAPAHLPPGGVLVVGASSTGVQLADEIQRSGRQVTIAVGRHTRLPRRYRGRDIMWWMDRLGLLSQDIRTVHDAAASRRQPSLQLVGTPDHRSVDLGVLVRNGVRLAGHLRAIDGHHALFDDDLAATMVAADVKLGDVLTRVDAFIANTHQVADPPEPFVPLWPHASDGVTSLNLARESIETIVWATGYRRSYPWLRVPVLDPSGEIVHERGNTAVPGLFVLGLKFQRRRNSSFIDGVGSDAYEIANEIAHLASRRRAA